MPQTAGKKASGFRSQWQVGSRSIQRHVPPPRFSRVRLVWSSAWPYLALLAEVLTSPLWQQPSARRVQVWATILGAVKRHPLYCSQCGIDLWSNPGSRWQPSDHIYTRAAGSTVSSTGRGIEFRCDCHPLVAAEVPWRELRQQTRECWRYLGSRLARRLWTDTFLLTAVLLFLLQVWLVDAAFQDATTTRSFLCTVGGWVSALVAMKFPRYDVWHRVLLVSVFSGVGGAAIYQLIVDTVAALRATV